MLITFILLAASIALIPGPTNLFVLAQGLTSEKRRVAVALAGIATANAVWVSLCALGVSALLVASQHVLVLLRLAGVVYLTYLGFCLLFARADFVPADAGSLGGYRVVVVQGFLTSITNPKALVFYTAFLPQFVSSHAQAGAEIFAWGALYIVVALGVFLAYGLLAAQVAEWLTHYRALAQRVVGLGLIGSALTLLRWRAR